MSCIDVTVCTVVGHPVASPTTSNDLIPQADLLTIYQTPHTELWVDRVLRTENHSFAFQSLRSAYGVDSADVWFGFNYGPSSLDGLIATYTGS